MEACRRCRLHVPTARLGRSRRLLVESRLAPLLDVEVKSVSPPEIVLATAPRRVVSASKTFADAVVALPNFGKLRRNQLLCWPIRRRRHRRPERRHRRLHGAVIGDQTDSSSDAASSDRSNSNKSPSLFPSPAATPPSPPPTPTLHPPIAELPKSLRSARYVRFGRYYRISFASTDRQSAVVYTRGDPWYNR